MVTLLVAAHMASFLAGSAHSLRCSLVDGPFFWPLTWGLQSSSGFTWTASDITLSGTACRYSQSQHTLPGLSSLPLKSFWKFSLPPNFRILHSYKTSTMWTMPKSANSWRMAGHSWTMAVATSECQGSWAQLNEPWGNNFLVSRLGTGCPSSFIWKQHLSNELSLHSWGCDGWVLTNSWDALKAVQLYSFL